MAERRVPFQDAVYRCNKCGFCQAACATYQAAQNEALTGRGFLRLLKAVVEGELELGEGLAQRLYACFMCQACTSTCPSGAPVEEALLAARRELARAGWTPAPLAKLAETVARTGSPPGAPAGGRLAWTEGLDSTPPQGGQHDLVYFAGCLAEPDIAQSMIKLLAWAGEDYAILGERERCCGYPLLISGLVDAARDLAVANWTQVREMGARRLLTTCASGYRMWRQFYPQLLGQKLGLEVLHASEWLMEAGCPLRPWEVKITYHDPCSLGRGCGLYDPPRRFLARIEGLQVAEMANTKAEALCCGAGGNMEQLDADLARAAASSRMQQAAQTGAEMVVTACPACKRMLSRAQFDRHSLPVLDIVEVAWRSISRTPLLCMCD